jgi:cysteine desulfuration protein SufE
MNKNIYPPKLSEVISLLELLDDQTDRIDFLIDYSGKFKQVPDKIAVRPFPDQNKVQYCESEAYVWTDEQEDGTIKLYFAIENPQGVSAKAFAAILDETLSGELPSVILQIPDDIVFKIFGQNLSMGKNLGLTGILLMIKRQIKQTAIKQ